MTVIDAMGEFEMFDCFLAKCQEGLNLSEMLDEQISVCKRDLIQNKGESAAHFCITGRECDVFVRGIT